MQQTQLEKPTFRVRCLDGWLDELIVGQIYEATDFNHDLFALKGFPKGTDSWFKTRFEILPTEDTKDKSVEPIKIKCLDRTDESFLTIGKVYDLLRETNGLFVIIGDNGEEVNCSKSRFEVLSAKEESKIEETLPIKKRMRCLNNKGYESLLTLGKEYSIEDSYATDMLRTIGDQGKTVNAYRYRFEVVQEETWMMKAGTKFIQCLHNNATNQLLTEKHIYEVEKETKNEYQLKGIAGSFLKSRFELLPVEELKKEVLPIKIKCLDNSKGYENLLTFGKEYDVVPQYNDQMFGFMGDNESGQHTAFKNRFEIISSKEKEIVEEKKIFVKCVDAIGAEELLEGQIYEVIFSDSISPICYSLKGVKTGWYKTRFSNATLEEYETQEAASPAEAPKQYVRCINNDDFGKDRLILNQVYEVAAEKGVNFLLKGIIPSFKETRFQLLSAEEAAKLKAEDIFIPNDKEVSPYMVKCLSPRENLVRDQLYEVLGENGDDFYLEGVTLSFMKSRFEKVESPKEKSSEKVVWVKCIDPHIDGRILMNEVYEVEREDMCFYKIKDLPNTYFKSRFVLAEPASKEITNTVSMPEVSKEKEPEPLRLRCIDARAHDGTGEVLLIEGEIYEPDPGTTYRIKGQLWNPGRFQVVKEENLEVKDSTPILKKVRCINADSVNGILIKGQIYEVESVNPSLGPYRSYHLKGVAGGWYSSRFEDVEVPIENMISKEVEVPKKENATKIRLRCIDASPPGTVKNKSLIEGEIYEVELDKAGSYRINGETWRKDRFQIVVADAEEMVEPASQEVAKEVSDTAVKTEQLFVKCIDASAADFGSEKPPILGQIYEVENYNCLIDHGYSLKGHKGYWRKSRFEIVATPRRRFRCINPIGSLVKNEIYELVKIKDNCNYLLLINGQEHGGFWPQRFEEVAAETIKPVEIEKLVEPKNFSIWKEGYGWDNSRDGDGVIPNPSALWTKEAAEKNLYQWYNGNKNYTIRCISSEQPLEEQKIWSTWKEGYGWSSSKALDGKEPLNLYTKADAEKQLSAEMKCDKTTHSVRQFIAPLETEEKVIETIIRIKCIKDHARHSGERLVLGQVYEATQNQLNCHFIIDGLNWSPDRFKILGTSDLETKPMEESKALKNETKSRMIRVKCIDNSTRSSGEKLVLGQIYEAEEINNYSNDSIYLYLIEGVNWEPARFKVVSDETAEQKIKELKQEVPVSFKVRCIDNEMRTTGETLVLNRVYEVIPDLECAGNYLIDGVSWNDVRFKKVEEEEILVVDPLSNSKKVEEEKISIAIDPLSNSDMVRCLNDQYGDGFLKSGSLYKIEKDFTFNGCYLLEGSTIQWHQNRFERLSLGKVASLEQKVKDELASPAEKIVATKSLKLECIDDYTFGIAKGSIVEATFDANGDYIINGTTYHNSLFKPVSPNSAVEVPMPEKMVKVEVIYDIINLNKGSIYNAVKDRTDYLINGTLYDSSCFKLIETFEVECLTSNFTALANKGEIHEAYEDRQGYYVVKGRLWEKEYWKRIESETPPKDTIVVPKKQVRCIAACSGLLTEGRIYYVQNEGSNSNCYQIICDNGTRHPCLKDRFVLIEASEEAPLEKELPKKLVKSIIGVVDKLTTGVVYQVQGKSDMFEGYKIVCDDGIIYDCPENYFVSENETKETQLQKIETSKKLLVRCTDNSDYVDVLISEQVYQVESITEDGQYEIICEDSQSRLFVTSRFISVKEAKEEDKGKMKKVRCRLSFKSYNLVSGQDYEGFKDNFGYWVVNDQQFHQDYFELLPEVETSVLPVVEKTKAFKKVKCIQNFHFKNYGELVKGHIYEVETSSFGENYTLKENNQIYAKSYFEELEASTPTPVLEEKISSAEVPENKLEEVKSSLDELKELVQSFQKHFGLDKGLESKGQAAQSSVKESSSMPLLFACIGAGAGLSHLASAGKNPAQKKPIKKKEQKEEGSCN